MKTGNIKNNIDNNTENNNDIVDIRKKKFWKFWFVLSLLMLGIVVVIARLLYIQIINNDFYKSRAKRQQQTQRTLIPQRGNIYDRNGNLLASTIKSITIAADPTVLKDKNKLAATIEKHIGIDQKIILNKINSVNGQYVELCYRVLPEKVEPIKKLKDPGVILIDEPIRYYNYSNVASQILGTANKENQGQGGLEMKYNSVLMGKEGYMIMYKDAKKRLRPALDLPQIEPVSGSDIYLTLDIELQKIVEFELMQGVENSGSVSGTAIALNPNTGEVLACASYPGYNPNIKTSYNSDDVRIRSVTDSYEPGSTFKTITAAAGIEEKKVKTTDLFNGFNGAFVQPTYTIKDEHPLGVANFTDAFRYSSNIILSQVALKIGNHRYYKYIRDFGFGLKTGIDLPGEVSGRIPKFDALNPVDKRYLGFGYGIMATPIQIATAYSAIANNGKLMKPYIVSKISDDKKNIKEIKPQFIRNVISESTAKTMKTLLKNVINNGTGKKAFVEGLDIAGKTGTTQLLIGGKYSKGNYFASFAGFYPADNPQVCMLILLQSNSFGGAIAAPIFRNIALRWASVSPETISNNISNKTTINTLGNKINKNLVYVPELIGYNITDANNILNDIGLTPITNQQSGIIISQFPKAGSRLKHKSEIMLKTSNNNDTLTKNFNQIIGLPLRKALALLHNYGYKAQIIGTGNVISISWKGINERVAVLHCK